MLKELCLDNLGDLSDGAARTIADREIRTAVHDLMERGAEDGKVRTVNLVLTLGLIRGDIVCDLAVKAALPAKRTPPTNCKEKDRKGESIFVFRDDNAENADQPTLPLE
jgi:hypothetical protein